MIYSLITVDSSVDKTDSSMYSVIVSLGGTSLDSPSNNSAALTGILKNNKTNANNKATKHSINIIRLILINEISH